MCILTVSRFKICVPPGRLTNSVLLFLFPQIEAECLQIPPFLFSQGCYTASTHNLPNKWITSSRCLFYSVTVGHLNLPWLNQVCGRGRSSRSARTRGKPPPPIQATLVFEVWLGVYGIYLFFTTILTSWNILLGPEQFPGGGGILWAGGGGGPEIWVVRGAPSLPPGEGRVGDGALKST